MPGATAGTDPDEKGPATPKNTLQHDCSQQRHPGRRGAADFGFWQGGEPARSGI